MTQTTTPADLENGPSEDDMPDHLDVRNIEEHPLPTIAGVKIRRAFGQMPYLGGSVIPRMETAEQVVETLGNLAEILRRTAARHEAEAEELRQLQSDRDALRRLLGTQA